MLLLLAVSRWGVVLQPSLIHLSSSTLTPGLAAPPSFLVKPLHQIPCPNMDYSAISHDPDHPSDASPWGSPRADRTTFPTSNNDTPSSPLPGEEYRSDAERREEAEQQAPDLSAQLQRAQIADPNYSQEQPQAATPHHPARYHPGPRSNARPPAPAYKIQGKITGLERTGKKDPVLRFDIHVGRPC